MLRTDSDTVIQIVILSYSGQRHKAQVWYADKIDLFNTCVSVSGHFFVLRLEYYVVCIDKEFFDSYLNVLICMLCSSFNIKGKHATFQSKPIIQFTLYSSVISFVCHLSSFVVVRFVPGTDTSLPNSDICVDGNQIL